MLWRIDLQYARYGIITVDDAVTGAPPIAAWMIGKSIERVRAWVLGKGSTMEVV